MVEIKNLTAFPIDKSFFKKIVKVILKKEEKKGNLSIVLLRPKEIKRLNKKFLGKNRVTDVLSFGQKPGLVFFNELGEIVICPKKVKENSKRFSTDFKRELAMVLVHGLLHLLDYDHEKKKEKKIMEEKEKFYLNTIF